VVNVAAGSYPFCWTIGFCWLHYGSAGSYCSYWMLCFCWVYVPAVSMVSAGCTMFLLVVIVSAGRLVSAGSYPFCWTIGFCWSHYGSAGSYPFCWLLFVYAANTSIHAAGLLDIAGSHHESGVSPFADSADSSSPSNVTTDPIPIDVLFASTSGGITDFFLDSDEEEQLGRSRVATDPDSD
ncbi:hypothetical protein Tco_1282733, partial [Tanacetum coccineum]